MLAGMNGGSGPLVITDYIHSEIGWTFLQAAKEAGFAPMDISGEKNNEGVSIMHATVNNGVRWSTAKAYLRPAIARHNLHVATNALVTKVSGEATTWRRHKTKVYSLLYI